MAAYIWWSLIAVHLFWSMWGLVTDFVLIGETDQSITEYLQRHSLAFILPSIVGLIAWGVLFWHLFIQARR